MKDCGIVRRIDSLGRIVIAKELRRTLNLPEGTPMEAYVEGESIILKKYERGCIFCSEVEKDMTTFKGQLICKKCLGDLII